MSKYIFKTVLCAALAMPALVSCELDQYPETSLPTEKLWGKVSDATNFNVGMLACVRSVSSAGYGIVGEVQSDLFNLISASPSYSLVANWRFTSSQFEGNGLWSGSYNMIANANEVINNIHRVPVEEGSDDAKKIQEYTGTAYFARAYGYASMVTRFCKNYEADKADQILGLPIVKEVDVLAKPKRSNLKDTYDLILADLAEAEKCFAETPVQIDRPNIYTVKALKARVLLNMQRYQEAVNVAKEVMEAYPLINNAEDFASMWQLDDGSEIIYQATQTPEERIFTYGAFIGYDIVFNTMSASYIPTQGLINLYETTDYRRDVYFAQTPATSGTIIDEPYLLAKFPGNPALLKPGEVEGQTFVNMTKAFRVAEMYLIAAEAQYNIDQTEGGFLNALRAARGASEVTETGEKLLQTIKDEWAREMVGEGFRLDCLKRWNKGFTRMAPQTLIDGFLNNQQGYQKLEISADNYKFIWEIPSQDLQANKNLERNWPVE